MSADDLLAEALGDTPETAIPVHLLSKRLAETFVDGPASCFSAGVVQSHSSPDEPWCFGQDAASVWGLLRQINGWGSRNMSPNVSPELAGPLSELIRREEDVRVQHYADVYHTLTESVAEFSVPKVRLLRVNDVGLLAASRREPRDLGFETFDELLTHGVAAGAIIGGNLKALAHTNALTDKFGDIGVYTDQAWRGGGFATASACIVAREVQRLGRTPVWSAGEGNAESLRVANKLGFKEVSRRVYLSLTRF